jgi:ribose-phosphate pyrophosphokinase
MSSDKVMLFAGSASTHLCRKICEYLGTSVRESQTMAFSDGNTFVRILENVRGRDVFVVQSIVHRPNDYFMELMFLTDALKRASAASVTAVIPYFGYGKGDKKDEPRVSIRARVCADALESAGVGRIVTMDLHAPQIQGFFRVPVDNLYGHPTLCDHLKPFLEKDCVVVAPDTGFADEARAYANYLGFPVAIGDKQRSGHDERAKVSDIIGDVRDRTALIVDDFVVSGGTLVQIAAKLKEKGARRILAAVTHAILSPGSIDRIQDSPIERLVVTDTVQGDGIARSGKTETVTVATCFGEAMRRIDRKESISEMFPS